MEGHEPTLKAPAMQRELEALAKNGIELELREVEQTETKSRNKEREGNRPSHNNDSIRTLEVTQMSTTSTTSTPSGNSQPSEQVNEQNWPLHVEARLKQIGQSLEQQNSTGAVVKGALVTTGCVVVGSLAARGLWKFGTWIFTPSPVKAAK